MIKYLLLILLAGCSTTSGLYEIECTKPGAAEYFIYRTADSYRMSESNTLTITDSGTTYYYSVPEGSACRALPKENSKTHEQEED